MIKLVQLLHLLKYISKCNWVPPTTSELVICALFILLFVSKRVMTVLFLLNPSTAVRLHRPQKFEWLWNINCPWGCVLSLDLVPSSDKERCSTGHHCLICTDGSFVLSHFFAASLFKARVVNQCFSTGTTAGSTTILWWQTTTQISI